MHHEQLLTLAQRQVSGCFWRSNKWRTGVFSVRLEFEFGAISPLNMMTATVAATFAPLPILTLLMLVSVWVTAAKLWVKNARSQRLHFGRYCRFFGAEAHQHPCLAGECPN